VERDAAGSAKCRDAALTSAQCIGFAMRFAFFGSAVRSPFGLAIDMVYNKQAAN
jgi:hypothetical protein